ncbi:hypothetical protein RHGRI_022187 [Rhododendron griersonianum]|nr:hypothetical protein RHGRI_022187 [Rhododendron griersonianum]
MMCHGEFLDRADEKGWAYYNELAEINAKFWDCNKNIDDANSHIRKEEQIEPIVACEGVELGLEKVLECDWSNEINTQSFSQEDFTCVSVTPFYSKTLEDLIPILVKSPIELENHAHSAVDYATPPIKPPPLLDFHRVELIDFLGVDNFNTIFPLFLVDIVNSLKFRKQRKQLQYSKYLIMWHGRVQFLKESSKGGEVFIFVTLHGVMEVQNPCERGTVLFVDYFR